MTIQYIHVLDAVNALAGLRDGFKESPLVKQLVLSLEVYKQRGEFDGTMDSAYECLTLAEYELEPKKGN
jgi:hypothetical protein